MEGRQVHSPPHRANLPVPSSAVPGLAGDHQGCRRLFTTPHHRLNLLPIFLPSSPGPSYCDCRPWPLLEIWPHPMRLVPNLPFP